MDLLLAGVIVIALFMFGINILSAILTLLIILPSAIVDTVMYND